MTPKEKAEYLFQKYLPYTHNETTEKIKIDTIKCALIAVKEILKYIPQFEYSQLEVTTTTEYNYLQEVKKELELM